MDKTTIIIVAASLVAVAAILAAVWMYLKKNQTERLHSRFGPEYDRLEEAEGDRRRAEKTLHERQRWENPLRTRSIRALRLLLCTPDALRWRNRGGKTIATG